MQSLYSGLVAYLNLQDISGTRLDLTANNNNATGGAVTSVDGLLGRGSGYAAGATSNCSSNTTNQGGPKDYTFALWVKFASVSASAYGLLSKLSGVAGHKEYLLRYTGTGTDRFTFTVYRATDSAQLVTANSYGAVSTHMNEWIFICAWNDHANLSVNIEINAGTPDSTSLAGATQAASTDPMVLGADDSTPTNPLTGSLSEFAKWDRVLTKQERRWLYNNGRGRTYPFYSNLSLGSSRHGRSRRMQGIG